MIIYVKNKHTLRVDDFKFKCCVGKKGISKKKIEGDLKTPVGIYKLGPLFFRKDKVKKLFPEGTELVYSRVLKYNRNCFIPSHIDTYDEDWQQANDISVIIQLNPRDDYTGGDAIVSNQLFELNPGDCIYYTYDNEHEIKKIKSGIRYVVNLRCKSVK